MKPKCKVNRSLVPIKVYYFFFWAATSSIIPYMPVYLKHIGRQPIEVATIYGTLPFVAILSKPLFGILADKLQRHKAILLCLVCCMMVMYTSISFLPSADMHTTSVPPRTIRATLLCTGGNQHISSISAANTTDCDALANATASAASTNGVSITCSRHQQCMNATGGTGNETALCDGATFVLRPMSYHTPIDAAHATSNHTHAADTNSNTTTTCSVSVQHMPSAEQDKQQHGNTSSQSVCYNGDDMSSSDAVTCQVMGKETESQYQVTVYGLYFWIIFSILFLARSSFGALFTLSDSVCVEILGDRADQFGKQVIWGSLGWGVGSTASAIIVQGGVTFTSTPEQQLNYTPAFYLFAALMLCVLVVSCGWLRVTTSFTVPDLSREVLLLVRQPHILMFSVGVVMHGLNFSIVMVYNFWYLRELDAPQTLLAILVLMEALTEIPYFFWSDWIIAKLSHIGVFSLGFVMFGARHIGIALLSEPWFAIISYLFHGASFPLMYATQISYCKLISPPGTVTTIQGLMGALFEGVGTGMGALLGGIIYSAIGGRRLFLYSGILSFLFAGVFGLVMCWLSRRVTLPPPQPLTSTATSSLPPPEDGGDEVQIKKGAEEDGEEVDVVVKPEVERRLIDSIHFMMEPTFWLDPSSHANVGGHTSHHHH